MNLSGINPHTRYMPRFEFEYSDDPGDDPGPAERSKLSGQPDVVIYMRHEPPAAAEAPEKVKSLAPGVAWEEMPTDRFGAVVQGAPAGQAVTYSPGVWIGTPPGVAWE